MASASAENALPDTGASLSARREAGFGFGAAGAVAVAVGDTGDTGDADDTGGPADGVLDAATEPPADCVRKPPRGVPRMSVVGAVGTIVERPIRTSVPGAGAA